MKDVIYTTSLYGSVDRWFKTKRSALKRQKYLLEAEEREYENPEEYITRWVKGKNHNPQVIG